jgi:nucleotide-binding universal stress UspA family protein
MRVFRRSQVVGHEAGPHPIPEIPMVRAPEANELLGEDVGPILVAVDGRPSGWHALEWAAAEAAVRQCSLRIVHSVDSHPVSWDVFGTFSADQWDADNKEVGALILREATDRAHTVCPALPITTHLVMGPIVEGVLQATRDDTLIVLGRRGHKPGRRQSLSTSVERQLARRARRPVAVVELSNGSMRGNSAGRVVVAFDRTRVPAVALGYAFRAAQRRGVGLTTLHVWERSSTRLNNSVRDALDACRDAFPEVDVRQRFATGPSSPVLVAESAGAALIVVASRSHGLQRSASHKLVADVLRSARSPITIVGAGRRREKHDFGVHHRSAQASK